MPTRIAISLLLLASATNPAGVAAEFHALVGANPLRLTHVMGLSADGSVAVGSDTMGHRWIACQGSVSPPGLTEFDGAMAVSGDGAVIAGMNGASSYTGFRWTSATGKAYLAAKSNGGFNHIPTATNFDGSVLIGFDSRGPDYQAFRWSEISGLEYLPSWPGAWNTSASDISRDGAVIVGQSDIAGISSAVRWDANNVIELVRESSIAYAISADGSAVVGAGDFAEGWIAFRWRSPNDIVSLGDLPGGPARSYAWDVTADGSIIVGASSSAESTYSWSGMESFIWDELNGIRSLKSVLINDYNLGPIVAGWTLEEAVAITWDGTVIVGNGRNPDGKREAWRAVLTPVPEPSALSLAGVGLALLCAVRLRRKPATHSP